MLHEAQPQEWTAFTRDALFNGGTELTAYSSDSALKTRGQLEKILTPPRQY